MLHELLGRTANIKGEDVVDPVHNFEEGGGPVGESVRAGMVRWRDVNVELHRCRHPCPLHHPSATLHRPRPPGLPLERELDVDR